MASDDLLAYAGMFWSALLAATILPGASEIVLIGFLVSDTGNPWAMLIVATAGNTIGSVVNWACGRFLIRYRDRWWFPVGGPALDRWSGLFKRYGLPSLLLAWAPIIGDVLTVAAGILRAPIGKFTLFVAIGKFARYLFIAVGTFAFTN